MQERVIFRPHINRRRLLKNMHNLEERSPKRSLSLFSLQPAAPQRASRGWDRRPGDQGTEKEDRGQRWRTNLTPWVPGAEGPWCLAGHEGPGSLGFHGDTAPDLPGVQLPLVLAIHLSQGLQQRGSGAVWPGETSASQPGACPLGGSFYF